MFAHRVLALGLVLGLLVAGPVRADEVATGVAAMPGAVDEVRIGGTWTDGNDSGVYRIVVTRSGGDEVTARLFVQWVAYTDDGGAAVRNSVEITEFAALKVDIDDFTAELDDDGLSVFIRTIDPNGPDDLAYELFVFSPSDHRFGLATNSEQFRRKGISPFRPELREKQVARGHS